jgi:hypothetical protein
VNSERRNRREEMSDKIRKKDLISHKNGTAFA